MPTKKIEMKNLKIAIVILFGLGLTTSFCLAQKTQQAQKDAVVGAWKGTSICQVKNSPCHDEIDVYHISKTEKQNVYRCMGNKIVNGQEVEMGTIDFVYDASKHSLTNIQNESGKWAFEINGDSMHGTLFSNNVLYRVVDLKRLK